MNNCIANYFHKQTTKLLSKLEESTLFVGMLLLLQINKQILVVENTKFILKCFIGEILLVTL